MDLINPIRPPWTQTQRLAFFNHTAATALSLGLTGIHNALTPLVDAEFFHSLGTSRTPVPIRLNLMVSCGTNERYCGEDFAHVRTRDAGDGRLTIGSVKLFADGALGSRGAALLEDYSDQPGWKGFLLMEEEKWDAIIRKWYDEVSLSVDNANSQLADDRGLAGVYTHDRR